MGAAGDASVGAATSSRDGAAPASYDGQLYAVHPSAETDEPRCTRRLGTEWADAEPAVRQGTATPALLVLRTAPDRPEEGILMVHSGTGS
ncbi:hypothetical protein [Streptomyces sp. NPDC088785]|uniref:hypothetical protein n=1 Tax=Streptomyces sp. NPDC088785 TaxID=3365897 RepID=UPI003812F86C